MFYHEIHLFLGEAVQAKDESKSRGLGEGDNPNQSLFNKHFVLTD